MTSPSSSFWYLSGFSNSEEVAVGRVDDIPFLLQDVLSEEGGLYDRADDWEAHIVVDGNLYTGQNVSLFLGTSEKDVSPILIRPFVLRSFVLLFLRFLQPASARPLAERLHMDLLVRW